MKDARRHDCTLGALVNSTVTNYFQLDWQSPTNSTSERRLGYSEKFEAIRRQWGWSGGFSGKLKHSM